jgi:hypothetical protein
MAEFGDRDLPDRPLLNIARDALIEDFRESELARHVRKLDFALSAFVFPQALDDLLGAPPSRFAANSAFVATTHQYFSPNIPIVGQGSMPSRGCIAISDDV